MKPPFEEHANYSLLKEAAALLRFKRPDLAKAIEIAIDELGEFYEKHGSKKAFHQGDAWQSPQSGKP